MLSVTADTNIYVSAYQFRGLPLRFIYLAATGEFRLDISPVILGEVLRILTRKFRWSGDALRELERDILSYGNLVTPTMTITAITDDPSDNRVLECAVAARSDLIVSGDVRHVLSLGSHAGISIIRVAEFLDRIS